MPEPDVLRSMAPNIEVLNLGFNLLGSWREVRQALALMNELLSVCRC